MTADSGCCRHCGDPKLYPTPDAHQHQPGACRDCFDDAASNYSVKLDGDSE